MNSNNPHSFYKVGVFDQLTITHGFRQRTVCVRPPCTNISTQRTVCDIHTYRNVFLGFTVWGVHTNGNDWVWMPRPIAHELILPHPVSQEGLSPTVSGSCGKDPPYRPHSLGDGSKCHRRKGLKTVCIAPHCTSAVTRLN